MKSIDYNYIAFKQAVTFDIPHSIENEAIGFFWLAWLDSARIVCAKKKPIDNYLEQDRN